MRGMLRTACALLSMGLALGSSSIQAGEACCQAPEASCSLTDYVDAACNQCEGCTANQSCDCCQCCDCCDKSGWFGYAGAIFLTRNDSNAGAFVAANPAGTPFLTGPQAFNDFSSESGYDLMLGRRFSNGDAIEVRYFGVDDIFDSNNFVAPGNFIGVGFTGPGGTSFFSRNWTQIKSVEANYKYFVGDRLSLIGGFRYLELNDTMRSTLNANVATGLYEFENHLYGGQLGADLLLTDPSNALELRVVGKAGLYYNEYNGGIREFQGNNFIGSFLGSDEGSAFVGDLLFSVSYWFNDHIALRTGYQLLWVGDVALGADEASRSLLNPSLLRNPKHDGDLFMQGAQVGIEFLW